MDQGGGAQRTARKDVARLERAIEKIDSRESKLHQDMVAAATDHGRVRELYEESGATAAHISIAHTTEHAIAQVILEKN